MSRKLDNRKLILWYDSRLYKALSIFSTAKLVFLSDIELISFEPHSLNFSH